MIPKANQQGSTIAPVNRSIAQSGSRVEWPLTFKLDQSQMKRLQEMQTEFKFNSDKTPRLHERVIRERLKAADWNRLYCDKIGVYRPCILISISRPEMYNVRLVFR